MSKSQPGHAVAVGQVIAPHELPTLSGGPAAMPDAGRVVHLQFRRFAGCPICDLHLRSFARRDAEMAAAGVREVVVFHSTAAELGKYESALPFAVVPDPARALYNEFGVGSSAAGMLRPRFWATIPATAWTFVTGVLTFKRRLPPNAPTGGRFGLPADFLVAPDGRVLAAKYGTHPSDHWTVDDVLKLAKTPARQAA